MSYNRYKYFFCGPHDDPRHLDKCPHFNPRTGEWNE